MVNNLKIDEDNQEDKLFQKSLKTRVNLRKKGKGKSKKNSSDNKKIYKYPKDSD